MVVAQSSPWDPHTMGDLQDPKMEVITVPHVWPYELWGYPLKIRPSKIGQKYML